MQELTREQHREAIGSLPHYFDRNMPEPLGELAAGLLLDFFCREIGPVLRNTAIADAQARMQARLAELDGELYQAPFTPWQRSHKRSR